MSHVTPDPSDTGADMDLTPMTEATATDDAPLAAEDLIEEVSIDGMCGVY